MKKLIPPEVIPKVWYHFFSTLNFARRPLGLPVPPNGMINGLTPPGPLRVIFQYDWAGCWWWLILWCCHLRVLPRSWQLSSKVEPMLVRISPLRNGLFLCTKHGPLILLWYCGPRFQPKNPSFSMQIRTSIRSTFEVDCCGRAVRCCTHIT